MAHWIKLPMEENCFLDLDKVVYALYVKGEGGNEDRVKVEFQCNSIKFFYEQDAVTILEELNNIAVA